MGRTPLGIEKTLLKAVRNCGMSRYRLARISGVSETALSFFVNGQRSLTLHSAAKLAGALRLELREIEEPRRRGRKAR